MGYHKIHRHDDYDEFRKSDGDRLRCIAKAADALAIGDMIEQGIRSQNNWSLLPLESCFSTGIPSYEMSGCLMSMAIFPSYLGKLSNYNKRQRLLQELMVHMNLKISGSKTALSLDYLEPLRDSIIRTLSKGDVDSTVKFLNSYYLRKEDLDSIVELSSFGSGHQASDPFAKIDAKTKAALTRALNKSTELLPYSIVAPGVKKMKSKAGAASQDVMDVDEDDAIDDDGHSDVNDDDDPETDAMIQKVKKDEKKSSAGGAEKKKQEPKQKPQTKSQNKKKK